ncbi:MAG TPA: uroporphyrinogen-III synthase [Paludibaculum sp.]|jgi:uroporphyrinogen-III synthase
MRIVALESRRAVEMAELMRRNGLEAFVAPSVREVALEENAGAVAFGEGLADGRYEAVICLTGVGVRRLAEVLKGRFEAMRSVVTIARGPKPAKALRELGVEPTEVAPDPATYRELLAIVERRTERRIAVQEYGRPDQRLLDGLAALGCSVDRVPVYQWAMPEDTRPLEEAVRRIADGAADIVVFTASVQWDHLHEVARRIGVDLAEPMHRIKLVSIGPTMTETIRAAGYEPWLEPSPPKLGVLVHELAMKLNVR